MRLKAHAAGCLGCGLRIMVSGSPTRPEHDFAFEDRPEPGDVVIETEGWRLFVDRHSLEQLRGSRITYDELPGLDAFHIGPAARRRR